MDVLGTYFTCANKKKVMYRLAVLEGHVYNRPISATTTTTQIAIFFV